jgi:hypothetical protein
LSSRIRALLFYGYQQQRPHGGAFLMRS